MPVTSGQRNMTEQQDAINREKENTLAEESF